MLDADKRKEIISGYRLHETDTGSPEVQIALLTIYDMCKAVDRGMVVEYIRLAAKSGGKSGAYVRSGAE